MNVHHLELFYYVARHGGISQAVRHMPYGIQQPAVSGQIIQLEESLGIRLFQRRPFALTSPGRKLYEFISPFFGKLTDVSAELRGEAEQRLRLGASARILRDHVPGVLRELHGKHPLLRLCLTQANQAEAENLLARQEIDLALTELDGQPTAGLKSATLLKLAPVLIVREDSPLRSAREIWEQETISQPLIAFGEQATLTRAFQSDLRRRGCHWPVTVEANSTELVETYTAEGFGIGLSVDVPGESRVTGLRKLALPGFARLEIAALWQGKLSPLPAAFLDVVKARAGGLARGGGEKAAK